MGILEAIVRWWCKLLYRARVHEMDLMEATPRFGNLYVSKNGFYEYMGKNLYLEVMAEIEIKKCSDPSCWYCGWVGKLFFLDPKLPHTETHWMIKAPLGENEDSPVDYLRILKEDCIVHTI